MFDAKIYVQRRNRLKKDVKSGLILFIGNEDSPYNYADNHYFPFRQDSSFLYFFGLDFPSLSAVIDIDKDSEIVFGNDPTVEEIVWTGTQPTLKSKCRKIGIDQTAPLDKIYDTLQKAIAQKRKIHYLPPYRAEHLIKIEKLLSIPTNKVASGASEELIKAVVAQRSKKSVEEIKEIQTAIDICTVMQVEAMKQSKAGKYEREIAGLMEQIAVSMGGSLAFPIIFSIHGETLHNLSHHNLMKKGDMVVNDSGAESALHYAGDITRTIPIGGKFSKKQSEIYNIVYNAHTKAIDAVKPSVKFRDVHILACTALAEGFKELGLMKGDTKQAVAEGAHALFFQCGLGHNMGLDVHDMENLGENYIGYTDTIKRNPQFGIRSLRMAKELEPGFVMTVEPGFYLIPELVDQWKSQNKFTQFINYDVVEKYRSFGGIRIEDDVLVTETGCKNLSLKIPKKIAEVESLASA
jgi:Xaa-Pro aminopeptidase